MRELLVDGGARCVHLRPYPPIPARTLEDDFGLLDGRSWAHAPVSAVPVR
ncbi:hypothetical protein ACI8AC_09340 [Geodermatophilus sp. SYSU D00758]